MLVSVFAPVILVVLGSGFISLAINYSSQLAAWTGIVLIAVGIFWGLILYFYYGGDG